MLTVPVEDEALDALIGVDIRSGAFQHVSYRPLKRLGEGGTAIAFLALRRAPYGECPVVVKVLRPGLVAQLGEKALLTVRKEAVSLGRLNEATPPSPFVVRLIEADLFPVEWGTKSLNLAWLAVEHVHGGHEGTTLAERIDHSLRTTSRAFDPARAARAIECACAGLEAVHGLGIIHRDIKPDNVLCCGSGEDEIFKIADFGIARPAGVAATFGLVVGTPGFAAPEMAALDPRALGAWSDVFGLACTFFTMLTGEPFFEFGSPVHAFALAKMPERRSILACAGLSDELRARPEACRAIDAALARATAPSHAARTSRAADLAEALLPHVRVDSRRPRSTRTAWAITDESTLPVASTWSLLNRGGPDVRVRDAAWSADGRCLAVTDRGLAFWDGTTFRDVPAAGLPAPGGLRFVRAIGPGRWLFGGDGGAFARFTPRGVDDVVVGDPGTRFSLFSGDLTDLAVFIGTGPHGPPLLFTLVGPRWTRPLPLRDVAAPTGLARIDDVRWLLVGRGAAALVAPLDREVSLLPEAAGIDLLCAAGRDDLRIGVAGGAGGAVLVCSDGQARLERLPSKADITSVAIDSTGRLWAASAGAAWMSLARAGAGGWMSVREDSGGSSPAVALWADAGIARIVTADGGVLEGRAVADPAAG